MKKRSMILEASNYMPESEEVLDALYSKTLDGLNGKEIKATDGSIWSAYVDDMSGTVYYTNTDILGDDYYVVGTPYWEGEPVIPFVLSDNGMPETIVYDNKTILPTTEEDYDFQDIVSAIARELGRVENEIKQYEYDGDVDEEEYEDEEPSGYDRVMKGPRADRENF